MEAKHKEIASIFRNRIIYLQHLEITFPQIMKEVRKSLITNYRIKNSLNEYGHVKCKPGLGRKPSVVKPRLVSAIKSWIYKNPIRPIRRMVKDFNVS